MPATLESIPAETPTGIPYKFQFYGYAETWTRNANQVQAILKVAGRDAAAFKEEVIGWTEWDGTSNRLTRHRPLIVPYTEHGSELYCESLELVKYGFRYNAARLNFADPFYSNWLNFDDEDAAGESQCWVKYLATFRRPTYNTLDSDDEISYSGGEKDRYCTVITKVQPREQKFSSYQVQAGDQALSEPWFRPDYNLVFEIIWHQVPANAVPLERWNTLLGTVNEGTFLITLGPNSVKTFVAQKVRFRGPRDDLMAYQGGDGRLYYDPCLVFEVKGGPDASTWNTFRQADNSYAALTVLDSEGTPAGPVHDTADFNTIFVPGS